jgi:hypothetical protein
MKLEGIEDEEIVKMAGSMLRRKGAWKGTNAKGCWGRQI